MRTTSINQRAIPGSATNDVSALTIRRLALYLFLFAILVRLIALIFSDNAASGDDMARLIHSRAIVDEHDFVPSDVWYPGHFWFLSIPSFAGLDTQVAAMVWTAIVSSLGIPVAFFLVNHLVGRKEAVVAAMVMALHALHIRASIVTLADAPFWTFMLMGIYGFFLYLDEGKRRSLFFGCVAAAVACSMRFEAWVLFPILGGSAVVLDRMNRINASSIRARRIILFTGGSLFFPIIWSIYSYLEFGEWFYLVNQLIRWRIENRDTYSTSLLYSLVFIPAVMFLAMGPFALLVTVRGFFRPYFRHKAAALWVFAVILAGISVFEIARGRPEVRFILTVSMPMLLFAGMGTDAIGQLMRFIRERNISMVICYTSVTWLVMVALTSNADSGVISRKLSAVSPVPRIDWRIREVDEWLRERWSPDIAIVVYVPSESEFGWQHVSAGPWLSLADKWYGKQVLSRYAGSEGARTQLHFANSAERLHEFLSNVACWRLVITRDDIDSIRSQISILEPEIAVEFDEPIPINNQFFVIDYTATCTNSAMDGGNASRF